MFDFEDDVYGGVPVRDAEMYDVDLAIAISSSLKPTPGAQIQAPLDVQRLVARQIAEAVGDERSGP